MANLFCCENVQPYRPATLKNDDKFRDFLRWVRYPRETTVQAQDDTSSDRLEQLKYPFVLQLVKQVNFGALECTRYFASTNDTSKEPFVEVTEQDLVAANYKKLNAYKNFKCNAHDKFFEVNVYEKDPNNQHHWRLNVARPASQIDL